MLLTFNERYSASMILRTLRTLRSAFLNAFVILVVSASCAGLPAEAQATNSVHFDPQSRVFRMDVAAITYAFGVNEKGELQTIYWAAA